MNKINKNLNRIQVGVSELYYTNKLCTLFLKNYFVLSWNNKNYLTFFKTSIYFLFYSVLKILHLNSMYKFNIYIYI